MKGINNMKIVDLLTKDELEAILDSEYDTETIEQIADMLDSAAAANMADNLAYLSDCRTELAEAIFNYIEALASAHGEENDMDMEEIDDSISHITNSLCKIEDAFTIAKELLGDEQSDETVIKRKLTDEEIDLFEDFLDKINNSPIDIIPIIIDEYFSKLITSDEEMEYDDEYEYDDECDEQEGQEEEVGENDFKNKLADIEEALQSFLNSL